MEALQILSRNEMRMVKGGDPNQPCGSGGSGGICVVCTTPGGTESWCRSDTSDATSVCRGIYPAYGDEVSGEWATCASPQVN